ncbi:MAG TPA: transcriptional regulator [Cytophagales bacterium]|nr:transcriptional regulator [Cytophagales bacterium]HAA20905.1 transcriptional regulator [Cytophagales bacterium]HAP65195.1 transcriptional regulator [Cytophagales bacterium]
MRSDCPVSYALDFFGDKWTFLIIRDIALEGKRYYKEFLGSKEGIATNILSDRLKRLEAAEVIVSKRDEKLKTQKVYSLTQKGKDLIPTLIEIMIWSKKYNPEVAVTDDFVEKATHKREEVVAYFLGQLR